MLLQAGLLAALPYLVMVIMVQVGGQVADYARIKNWMSTTNIRKSLNVTGIIKLSLYYTFIVNTRMHL